MESVNVEALQKDERIKDVVTKDLLCDCGLIHSTDVAVKVLGNGALEKALSFEGIEHFSATAKSKIEKAGGSIK